MSGFEGVLISQLDRNFLNMLKPFFIVYLDVVSFYCLSLCEMSANFYVQIFSSRSSEGKLNTCKDKYIKGHNNYTRKNGTVGEYGLIGS